MLLQVPFLRKGSKQSRPLGIKGRFDDADSDLKESFSANRGDQVGQFIAGFVVGVITILFVEMVILLYLEDRGKGAKK